MNPYAQPPEITFVIYSLAYLFACLGTLMLMTGISYIVQAFRTSSHYRSDSADFDDEEGGDDDRAVSSEDR